MTGRSRRVAAWLRRRWLWLAVGGLLGVLLISTIGRDGDRPADLTARTTLEMLPTGLPGDLIGEDDAPHLVNIEATGPTRAEAIANAEYYADSVVRQRVRFIEGLAADAEPLVEPAVDGPSEEFDLRGVVWRETVILADGPTTPIDVGLLGGLVVGLAVAAGAALVVERTSALVFSERSLRESLHGAPVLAGMPERWLSTGGLAIRDRATSRPAAAHRALAASVLDYLHRSEHRTVLVVAVDRTAARALISANLATALEEAGRRVVVVAADRQRNDLDRALGVGGEPGLREVLVAREEVPFVHAGVGLRVMPSGGGTSDDDLARYAVPDPVRIGAILEAGGRWADVVLIDAPPTPSFPDAQILAGVADAAVVVATAGVTRRADLRSLRSRLALSDTPVIGGVLVHSPRPSSAVRRSTPVRPNRPDVDVSGVGATAGS